MPENGDAERAGRLFLSADDELLAYERSKWAEGFFFLAGIDEAGRGCLAGPVVAAAVVFTDKAKVPAGIDDSKKLSPEARTELREAILSEPSILWAVAEVQAAEIDASDILRSTWKAMAGAVSQIQKAEFALVDGRPVKGLPIPSLAIVKGDAKSASIGAASILAKTHRDLLMERMALQYPGYGFEVHKGYGTKEHVEAIEKLGPCPEHRKSFEPLKTLLNPNPMIQDELF